MFRKINKYLYNKYKSDEKKISIKKTKKGGFINKLHKVDIYHFNKGRIKRFTYEGFFLNLKKSKYSFTLKLIYKVRKLKVLYKFFLPRSKYEYDKNFKKFKYVIRKN